MFHSTMNAVHDKLCAHFSHHEECEIVSRDSIVHIVLCYRLDSTGIISRWR